MEILSRWLSIASRQNQIHLTKQFETLGLSSGQYVFVLCVCEHAGLTQDKLAQHLVLNKSTVARVVAQLEESGFLYKETNRDDKRIFNVFPTPKATNALPQMNHIITQLNETLTKGFSNAEKQIFEQLLIRLTHNAASNAKEQ